VVVLGMDIRRSSTEYYNAVCDGLVKSGCLVKKMGVITTRHVFCGT
jgi:phosphomannomutase